MNKKIKLAAKSMNHASNQNLPKKRSTKLALEHHQAKKSLAATAGSYLPKRPTIRNLSSKKAHKVMNQL